jgi:hypothetical protein
VQFSLFRQCRISTAFALDAVSSVSWFIVKRYKCPKPQHQGATVCECSGEEV